MPVQTLPQAWLVAAQTRPSRRAKRRWRFSSHSPLCYSCFCGAARVKAADSLMGGGSALKAWWTIGAALFIKEETRAECCSQRKYVISRKINVYHSVLLQEQYPHSFLKHVMLHVVIYFNILIVFAKLLLRYLTWSGRLFLSHWNKSLSQTKSLSTEKSVKLLPLIFYL